MTPGPNDNETTPESIGSDALKASLFSKLFDKKAEAVSVGRYRILDEIGAGGMGQVFSAYDEELDRKVAIKVVHGASTSAQAKGRLRREAQALGKLAHPNVVTVHEIGEHNGQVFIAMEFVRGETLRQWRLAEDRSVPEILEVYLQAARGLQAAHEAGILHRDFKPDNALVGDDGRVRVLDFGLARAVVDERATTLPEELSKDERGDVALTKTGAILGTPSYMAPEQFLGEPTDAQTDQFGLCVSLWEALYGDRPFVGSSYSELEANVTEGVRGSGPRDAKVPGSVRAMLETGLAIDPAKRHPDVASIVTTLETVLSPRRSRWWVAAATVPLAALGGFVFLREPAAARSLEDCLPAAQRLEGIWDDEVRADLAANFEADPAPFVAASWASIQRQQDEIASEWAASYAQACANTSSADTATRRLAAQRLDCLDWMLPKIDVLANLDSAAAARQFAAGYHGTVGASSDWLACTNDATVRRLPAPPADPVVAARVQDVAREILGATALRLAGRPLDASSQLEGAVDQARSVGHPPLLAEALVYTASVEADLNRHGARAAVDRALRAAESAGHDHYIVEALMLRALRGESDEVRFEALDRAEAVLIRLGAPLPRTVAVARTRALVLDRAGRNAEAYDLLDKLTKVHGHNPTLAVSVRAGLYETLGGLVRSSREPQLRLAAAQAAIAIYEAELGSGHPACITAWEFAAYASYRLGRYEDSVAQHEELQALLRTVFPRGHPRLGFALTQLARAQAALGQVAESEQNLQRSEAMLSRLLDPTHLDVLRLPTLLLEGLALVTGNEQEFRRRAQLLAPAKLETPGALEGPAVIAALDGDFGLARTELGRARKVVQGSPHFEAGLRPLWCYILWLVGDQDAAVAEARRVADDPPSPEYVGQGAPAMAGFVFASTGDHARALPSLELALVRASKVDPPTVAWFSPMAHYALALSLEATGEHERAVKMARIAVTQGRVTGLPRLDIADKAQAWLAEHDA